VRSPHALFVFLASLFGLAYTFVTPPCYVPDEVAHFWRAVSIAHGTLNPTDGNAPLPKGYQVFVFCVMHANVKVEWQQMKDAWDIDQKTNEIVELKVVPASYSPANYVPQIAAAWIGRVTRIRPMIVFYLGRLFALAAFIALVAFAIRATPFLKWGFAAAALLPMSLFMAASWSADSMTIALAFLTTALALRGARDVASPVAAFFLGLCKPVNFLVAFIARRWIVPLAALAGFGVLALIARGAPPQTARLAHWPCVNRDFPGIVVNDYLASTAAYAEQMVGRLGRLDVILPKPIIWLEWALLALIAITAGEKIPRLQRLQTLVVSLLLMLSISAWMYLTWTPTCNPPILGIQGRYYLPLLPALLVAISNPWWRWKKPGAIALATVAVIANTFAAAAVGFRYYG